MAQRPRPAKRLLLPLIRAGLVSGIILAIGAFPIAATLGVVALWGSEVIDRLPSEVRDKPGPAQVTYLYASDGQTPITQIFEEYRHYVPLQEISPHMLRAIVSSEDSRFFEHAGVDRRGLLRALVANFGAGGVSQGASTLTMQYVRNLQRDSAQSAREVAEATSQTPARKLREMKLAVAVEKELSKEEILERYLNVAYFGHQAYGVYAGAQIYFSKVPKDLTLAESAMLAGLVQAPTSYDPSRNPGSAMTRRNYVIDKMVELKYLSPELGAKSKAEPVTLRMSTPRNGCAAVPADHNDWGFFCDIVRFWWRAQPAFGETPYQREENLRRGGYRIVTTLDPKMQDIAKKAVLSNQGSRSTFAHGLVAVEPGTGLIKAAAINRNYNSDQSKNGPNSNRIARTNGTKGSYPNTVAPLLGGGYLPGYQAGSTFKLFTILAALEAGMPLSERFNAPHMLKTNYSSGAGPCVPYWCPMNASGAMSGPQTMWSGFGKSVNTYMVYLEQKVGAEKVVRMAERLGITWRSEVDRRMSQPENANGWGAFTLGVSDTSPIELANAYATIAADGLYCNPSPVLSVTDAQGQPVELPVKQCRQVLDPEVARGAVDVSRCVTGYGAARGSCGGWSTADEVYPTVGRPVGGKTGTTDRSAAGWFVGITPQLAVASFISDPDSPGHAVGAGLSHQPVASVATFLRQALEGLPVIDFIPPSDKTARHGIN